MSDGKPTRVEVRGMPRIHPLLVRLPSSVAEARQREAAGERILVSPCWTEADERGWKEAGRGSK